jgi:hypothetical protein
MKPSRLFLAMALTTMVATSAAVAKGDGLPDPKIAVGKTDPDFAPVSINTSNFIISDDTGTSPALGPDGVTVIDGGSACVATPPGGDNGITDECYFENDITKKGVGQTINEITFDIPVPFGNDNCVTGDFDLAGTTITSIFSTCSAVDDGAGGTLFDFSGGQIKYKDDFFMSFQFPSAFSATTNAITPEPGTFAMLGIGLLALMGIGRKRLLGGTC